MKHSQGILNGKITKLNGDDDKFKTLVASMSRPIQIASWNHHKMIKHMKRK